MSDAIAAFLAHCWKRDPVTASFAGVRDHERTLPDWTREGRAFAVQELDALVRRLEEAHPVPGSGWDALARDADALDALVARAVGYVRIAETASGFFTDRNPSSWTGEAIGGIVALLLDDARPDGPPHAALAARLRALRFFLQELHATVEGPIPPAWVARAAGDCVALRRFLRRGLPAWLDAHDTDAGAAARRQVEHAATRAYDAVRECHAWLLRTQRVDARPPRAGGTEACGEALLTLLLRVGHCTDEAPRTLLARAERALPAARDAVAAAYAPFGGTRWHAWAEMAADRADAADFLRAFHDRRDALRAALVGADLLDWPDDRPIAYRPVPTWARAFRAARRLPAARVAGPLRPDAADAPHVHFVASVSATTPPLRAARRLARWHRTTIGIDHVVRAGECGVALRDRAARTGTSRLGAIAAVPGATRRATLQGTTLADGWTGYAMRLAEEAGALTPLERVAAAEHALHALGRAIVDLRLHLGDWSTTDCRWFLLDEAGMDEAEATRTVDDASMAPATAMAEWLGADAIVTLRDDLRRMQGAAYSARRFHAALLARGALPVPLLAQLLLPTEGTASERAPRGDE